MKIKLLLLLLLLTSVIVAQGKYDYDLGENSLRKSTHNHFDYDYLKVTNDKLEGTLLKDGYFTLGTAAGTSDSKLDDNCQITYGHPFAKTSYPVVIIDGEEYNYIDLFDELNSITSLSPSRSLIAYNENDQLIVSFKVTVSDTSDQLILEQKITNKSDNVISVGSKIVFDPALGKYGDGVIPLGGAYLQEESTFSPNDLLAPLSIFEKSSGSIGMVVEFEYAQTEPSSISAKNWLSDNQADLQITKLFDLLLEFNWDEVELAKDDTLTSRIVVNVLQPQFGDLFSRWDFPSYIDINNGLMFPSMFDSYLELYKSETYSNSEFTFDFNLPTSLSNNYSNTIAFNNSSNQVVKIPVNTKIIYENRIDEIGINILSNGKTVETINRKLFIPATPVSDEGLDVTIDSINSALYPKIDLVFHTTNEENGYFITILQKDNIFFYENDNRVTDFIFMKDTSGGINSADIVFVLDVTGSMGNEIGEVKNNIIEFSDMLSQKGIDYRFGMVTFLDEIENIYDFTKDVQLFHSQIEEQHAHGGGDGPENSLDALYTASEFNYRENAKRIIIWITDADYHEEDGITSRKAEDVTNTLLSKGIQVHNVGTEYFKSSHYDPIILPTAGNYYNINGNFRDILLDISNMKQSYKYVLSYTSTSTAANNNLKIQVHYAGLGGEATINISSGINKKSSALSYYPNPFNPEVTFNITHQNYSDGEINIYNILGQCVHTIPFTKANSNNLKWNAKNTMNIQVGTGFYIARLTLKNQGNIIHQESAKILYLK